MNCSDMSEDELHELLSLVDDPTNAVPADFEAELWSRLGERTSATSPVRPGVEIEGSEAHTSSGLLEVSALAGPRSRSLRTLVAATVLVALLCGGILTEIRSRPAAIDVATDEVSARACAEFEAVSPLPVLDLRDRILDNSAPATDRLEELAAAVDSFQDLATALGIANLVGTTEPHALSNAVGALRQAELELASGDGERAARSIEVARSHLESIPIGSALRVCIAPVLGLSD